MQKDYQTTGRIAMLLVANSLPISHAAAILGYVNGRLRTAASGRKQPFDQVYNERLVVTQSSRPR